MEKLIEQAPVVGALVFLVVYALKFLRERDVAFLRHVETRDKNFTDCLERVSSECHANQADATAAIREVRLTVSENTRVLGHVDATLQRLSG